MLVPLHGLLAEVLFNNSHLPSSSSSFVVAGQASAWTHMQSFTIQQWGKGQYHISRLLCGAEAPLRTPQPGLSDIWRQLPTVKMKTGKIARLPAGAGTPLSHSASKLLVRKVYAEFWALINEYPGDPHC